MTPGPTLILRCPCCGALLRQETLGSGNYHGAVFWSDGRVVAPGWREEAPVLRCPRCAATALRRQVTEVGILPSHNGEGAARDWRLTLVSCPAPAKLAVMRLLRAYFQLGLKEAQLAAEGPPVVLAEALPYEVAEAIEQSLRRAGAGTAREPARADEPEPAAPAEWTQAPLVQTADEAAILQLAAAAGRAPGEERLLRIEGWRAGNDAFRGDGARWVPPAERPAAAASLERLLSLLLPTDEDELLRGEALRQLGRFPEAARILSPLSAARPEARALLRLVEAGSDRLSTVSLLG